jgi:hypothetical protein
MKTLSLCSLIILSLLFSCSKKSESPSYKKADFAATWEENGSLQSGCTRLIKFDATKMYDGEKCAADQSFDSGTTYTYDNKNTITLDPSSGFAIKYVILSLNATTLKMDYYLNNVKFGTLTYTKL